MKAKLGKRNTEKKVFLFVSKAECGAGLGLVYKDRVKVLCQGTIVGLIKEEICGGKRK